MEKIHDQVLSIRDRFNTKAITDNTSKASLTNNEVEGIIDTIKNQKRDGFYEISDDIVVQLKNGHCYIKDNQDEQ